MVGHRLDSTVSEWEQKAKSFENYNEMSISVICEEFE
jgi:hypothetical protein